MPCQSHASDWPAHVDRCMGFAFLVLLNTHPPLSCGLSNTHTHLARVHQLDRLVTDAVSPFHSFTSVLSCKRSSIRISLQITCSSAHSCLWYCQTVIRRFDIVVCLELNRVIFDLAVKNGQFEFTGLGVVSIRGMAKDRTYSDTVIVVLPLTPGSRYRSS